MRKLHSSIALMAALSMATVSMPIAQSNATAPNIRTPTRRYVRGLTDEQIAWNDAVEAKKLAKLKAADKKNEEYKREVKKYYIKREIA